VAGVSSVEVDERGAPRLALAVALMRKDRLAQALEQCSELGITDFVPFASRRAHVARVGSGTIARLERVAVAAMKQSFRAHLPRVHSTAAFDGLLEYAGSFENVLVGEQAGGRIAPPLRGDTLVIVGPEAGLDERELAGLASAGAERVTASRHRLRTETACVALVAAAARAIDSPPQPA
jgi:16S rRNA (uracil1498-N3)-methyltransferase